MDKQKSLEAYLTYLTEHPLSKPRKCSMKLDLRFQFNECELQSQTTDNKFVVVFQPIKITKQARAA